MREFESRALRVLAGVTAVCVALFAVGAAGGWFPPAPVTWVLIMVAHGLSVLVCARTAVAGGLDPYARRFWRTASLGLAVMAGGLGLRLVTAVTGADLTSTAQIIHGAGALTMLWAVARLPVATRGGRSRIALWLDLAITMTASAIFLWHTAALEAVRDPAALATTVVMMGVGLIVVFLVAKLILAGSESLPRGVLHMFACACLVGGVGTAAGIALGDHSGLEPLLMVIPGAGLAIAIAARRQLPAPGGATATAGPPRQFSLLPYVAVAAVDGLLLHVVATDGRNALVVAIFAVLLTALVVYRQVNAFRDNEALKERFRLIAQNSSDIVTITDRDHNVKYLSPATLRVLGRHPDDLLGTQLRTFLHRDDLPLVQAAAVAVFTDPTSTATYQARFRHADGTWIWLEVVLSNLLDQPSVAGIVGNARDITQVRETQDRLSHDATHDALTGLANRVLFGQRVAENTRAPFPDHRFTVVLIDLDEFKLVNDTLGHAAGDALLVAVAERMLASVRPSDLVARLGGDEFAILFENLGGTDVTRVLDRIADQLRLPVEVDDQLLAVRASYGVAEGVSGDDAGDLLRRADVAMYEAKARGEGGHQRYEPGMDTQRAERARLNSTLQSALAGDEFVLHYQPVVSLPDGVPVGVEALLRWQHPQRGLLGPHEFLAAAEQNGLIVPLGRWVLREACRQAASWPASIASIAVNVSARQLHEGDFVAEVAAALHDHGLAASRLTLEITESTAVDPGRTRHGLEQLRALGVRIALDDFGTEASTLSVLATCPVDQIKLDRSFMPVPRPDAIARAVVQLADAMGLEAVAEGVETEEQRRRIIDLGYRRAQGYLFGRPVPAAELTAMLAVSPR
ncbi:putative bifunctional diguanylate cyclase/phosphodiesterase [Actinoplanes sp. NPDC051494]|uniref:putative bifunctional diguanylate cyclase/phosphodiesterase n=1 Tax=Actinoplanes sp. NPDC051494 TaxID=3363907 RepID=UPI0037949B5A